MARRCTGQATLICEGMLGDNASTEDMLNLWAVRIADATDAAAQLDTYLIQRAQARNTQGATQ